MHRRVFLPAPLRYATEVNKKVNAGVGIGVMPDFQHYVYVHQYPFS